MSKGLPLSMSRGNPIRQEIIKDVITVRDGSFNIIGEKGNISSSASLIISGLPKGNILFLGSVAYFSFAGSGSDPNLKADWGGAYEIVIFSPADSKQLDFTISPETQLGPASSQVSARTFIKNASQEIIDNSSGLLEIGLVVNTEPGAVTAGKEAKFTVNGNLHMAYIVFGID